MSTVIKHRKVFTLTLGFFTIAMMSAVLLGYWPRPARAGIPTTDPLFYAGLLTDKTSTPLSGNRSIGLVLWDAKTGGNKKCSTPAKTVALTHGRFRIAADKSCVQSIQDNKELWVEVTVNNTSMGRSKIGAVPFVAAIPDTVKVAKVGIGTSTPSSLLTVGNVPPKLGTYGSGDYNAAVAIKADATSNIGLTLLNDSTGGTDPVEIRFVNAFTGGAFNQIASIHAIPEQSWTSSNSTRDGALVFKTNKDGTPLEKARVTSEGKVGIGTAKPTDKLHIHGGNVLVEHGNNDARVSVRGVAISGSHKGGYGYVDLKTSNAGSPTKVHLDANGYNYFNGVNVGIGMTTPKMPLVVSDGTSPDAYCDGNSWITASSREAKRDIKRFSSADYRKVSTKLNKTDVVWYRYKGSKDPRRRVGLIAEDVPEELATADRKGISTADAVGFLMAVVKDQQRQIDELQRKMNRLQARR